jgi:choline monooxygenase
MPFKGVLPELLRTRDHQSTAICHYTIFPTQVFNNNPNHIQLFRAVPLAVDRTRFETWELQYSGGDAAYEDGVNAHWDGSRRSSKRTSKYSRSGPLPAPPRPTDVTS